jgi:hypothetical protein
MWIEANVAAKTIKPLPEDRIPIKAVWGRRQVDTGRTLKRGGMGCQFLKDREKNPWKWECPTTSRISVG